MALKAQFQQVREAPAEEVNTSLQTYEAAASSLITLQVASLRLAQSLFLNGIELFLPLRRQTTQQQRDPFQSLIADSTQLYLGSLFAPLTLSRKLVEASLIMMECEQEKAQ